MTKTVYSIPSCRLPDLPQPIAPEVVGFPTPETILVSKTDMISIIDYVTAMQNWIEAAAVCLKAGQ